MAPLRREPQRVGRQLTPLLELAFLMLFNGLSSSRKASSAHVQPNAALFIDRGRLAAASGSWLCPATFTVNVDLSDLP
jgi:hypothetical protein